MTIEIERRGGAVETARGCFLCAYGDHGCDVASVEGRLLAVAAGPRRGDPAAILLKSDLDDVLRVTLPEHTRPILRALADAPTERLHRLRARVYHLMRVAPAGPIDTDAEHGATIRLRATPASALVLEPDLLLNITDINNAEYCVRQYPLRRMVPSPPTAATLRGIILHGAFKELLKGDTGSIATPDAHLHRAARAHLTDLALSQLGYDDVTAAAVPHMHALADWYAHERQNLWGQVPRIRAETFLLAPEVGLKGRLDFLVQDEHGGALLELKTGKATASLPKREHRWQVHGYQTLLAARRPHDVARPGATLLYSGTPGHAEGYGIPYQLRDLHAVLDLRNRLALVHAAGVVPAPPSPAKCARCVLRPDCLRASALLGWESPASDEPPDALEAPDPSDAGWFDEQYELLRLEARAAEAQGTALWRLPPEQRRAAGIALGGLAQDGEPRPTASGEWEYHFHCENTSELREGDAILLSDGDPIGGAVVSGTILRLTARGIVVWTPERIANPRLLDRYESDIVHTRTVRNLWRWLDADPHARALVAGRQRPRFRPLPALDNLPAVFNAEQREAVSRALAAEDFLLIQGPPGTGKTRVVAEIARRAALRGERVLIAAFTNQAVDNVLRRLLDDGFDDFVRLGHRLSVAPELRAYRLAARARRAAGLSGDGDDEDDDISDTADDVPNGLNLLTPEHVRDTLRAAPIAAATTATWSAERFAPGGEAVRFNLAIVDEASQLTVPALLGALRFARRFVLVGDGRQLPPLVVSEEAAARGLKRSLFTALLERWCDQASEASVALRKQYRMHPVICGFPSRAFYAGALEADGPARTAQLRLSGELPAHLATVLDPHHPLVFVNVPAREDFPEPSGKASPAQARVVTRLVRALLEADVLPEQIGVIAPYRAQVAAIRQRLSIRNIGGVTVDTVDRFQGAERQVILFSFGGRVMESPYTRGMDFLADPNRLNVALTRAQRKLILVGERRMLESVPLLRELLTYCAALYGGRGGLVTARVSME